MILGNLNEQKRDEIKKQLQEKTKNKKPAPYKGVNLETGKIVEIPFEDEKDKN